MTFYNSTSATLSEPSLDERAEMNLTRRISSQPSFSAYGILKYHGGQTLSRAHELSGRSSRFAVKNAVILAVTLKVGTPRSSRMVFCHSLPPPTYAKRAPQYPSMVSGSTLLSSGLALVPQRRILLASRVPA